MLYDTRKQVAYLKYLKIKSDPMILYSVKLTFKYRQHTYQHVRIQRLLFLKNLLENKLRTTKITSDRDTRTGDKH